MSFVAKLAPFPLLVAACATPCPTCPDPACPQAGTAAPVVGAPNQPAAAPKAPGATPKGMVTVPAGEFLRGSPENVGLKDEHPQRTIFLDAFAIDKTEVSVAAYKQCVDAGKCEPAGCAKEGHEVETRDNHPVNCVTWAQADAYCKWADKRLPTEAEWEKAARGTDGRTWPWGEGEPTCERANHRECGKDRKPVDALPKGASPYGALNMAGNVYEWVADWHDRAYYARSPAKNPPGPKSGKKKVLRGGAFSYDKDELITHGRTFDRPTKAYDQVGFRCAK